MESTNPLYKNLKPKQLLYSILMAAAFSWPWLWTAITGSSGEGDLVDLLSLGMIPVIIIGAIALYRETKSRPSSYRWAFGMALAAAFLLVWIIPAVGIYGESGAPADLPYYYILAVGIAGALISRFRPRAMALVLLAMAVGQLLVEVNGLLSGWGTRWILNGFFAALWIGSALLFLRAAKEEPKPDVKKANNK